MFRRGLKFISLALAVAFLSASCSAQSTASAFEDQLSSIEGLSQAGLDGGRRLRVVATTNIIGDVVANVGGDSIELTRLLPLGADPHGYQMTASDLQAVRQADVVFLNGLGLEESMYTSLQQFVDQVPMISISEGIEVLSFGGIEEGQTEDAGQGHDIDPHVWMDPVRVVAWVENINQALSRLDPGQAEAYQVNASAYIKELGELDDWIQSQIDSLPSQRRILVTDHDNLGYFADRYGIQLVGAIVPAYSAAAEPSAQQLAQLQDTIQAMDVPAIFVGTTVNPDLATQIADDLGIQVVPIYTGSLSESDSPASTYLQFMRYDVNMIVEALN